MGLIVEDSSLKIWIRELVWKFNYKITNNLSDSVYLSF